MTQLLQAETAVLDIHSGATIVVGGFGVCGIPTLLLRALHAQGTDELTIVSNNCGVDGIGLGPLLTDGQIATMRSSYVGENREFARQFLGGELTVELMPQGTLAERLRAGGVGIPAFYTPAGVGTWVADGGMPLRYSQDGSVAVASKAKETREIDGRQYVLEHAITCDVALVHAKVGDRHGNLVFAKAARNFNPLAAMAARVTIAEVEELVDELDPDAVHLPGIFVDRLVVAGDVAKHIEKRTVALPVEEAAR